MVIQFKHILLKPVVIQSKHQLKSIVIQYKHLLSMKWHNQLYVMLGYGLGLGLGLGLWLGVKIGLGVDRTTMAKKIFVHYKQG